MNIWIVKYRGNDSWQLWTEDYLKSHLLGVEEFHPLDYSAATQEVFLLIRNDAV